VLEVLEELRAIGLHAGAELVEDLDRQAAGIAGRLEHQGRNRADQNRLRHAPGAVASDVARDLTAAGGMADMDRVVQIELLDELRKIVRIGIEIVAVPRLARAAVAAAVMGNAPVPARGEEEHLVFERVAGQGPAVAEHDRLPLSPVTVVDLRAVFRGNRRHIGPR
jgi:hypothetical protein